MTVTSVKFSFSNDKGQILSGLIDIPPAGISPKYSGVFGPCFTCVKKSNGAVKICRALAERGVAMMRFDTTGVGESQGTLSDTNFTTRINDIIAACNAIKKDYATPAFFIGHSISGTAGLSALQHLPYIKLLATVGSPSDPNDTIKKFRENGIMTETNEGATINVLGQPVLFGPHFVEDMLSQNVEADTASFDKKLLIFHAPHDKIVSVSNAQRIHDRAPASELIIMSDTATHLFERGTEDAVFVAEKIITAIG